MTSVGLARFTLLSRLVGAHDRDLLFASADLAHLSILSDAVALAATAAANEGGWLMVLVAGSGW